jgi:hypothetical protein
MAIRFSLPALALGAALLVAGPNGLGPVESYAQGCMSQAQARQAVANGQAASFSAFSGSLRSMGQVVSSCLASSGGGGLVYVVQVVPPGGNVTRVVLDARTGRRLN